MKLEGGKHYLICLHVMAKVEFFGGQTCAEVILNYLTVRTIFHNYIKKTLSYCSLLQCILNSYFTFFFLLMAQMPVWSSATLWLLAAIICFAFSTWHFLRVTASLQNTYGISCLLAATMRRMRVKSEQNGGWHLAKGWFEVCVQWAHLYESKLVSASSWTTVMSLS